MTPASRTPIQSPAAATALRSLLNIRNADLRVEITVFERQPGDRAVAQYRLFLDDRSLDDFFEDTGPSLWIFWGGRWRSANDCVAFAEEVDMIHADHDS